MVGKSDRKELLESPWGAELQEEREKPWSSELGIFRPGNEEKGGAGGALLSPEGMPKKSNSSQQVQAQNSLSPGCSWSGCSCPGQREEPQHPNPAGSEQDSSGIPLILHTDFHLPNQTGAVPTLPRVPFYRFCDKDSPAVPKVPLWPHEVALRTLCQLLKGQEKRMRHQLEQQTANRAIGCLSLPK